MGPGGGGFSGGGGGFGGFGGPGGGGFGPGGGWGPPLGGPGFGFGGPGLWGGPAFWGGSGFFGGFAEGLCSMITSVLSCLCCCWLIQDCLDGPQTQSPYYYGTQTQRFD